MAKLLRIEGHRVILVDWLGIEHGFDRCAVVVLARLVVAPGKVDLVTILPHIEIEPRLVVKPRTRPRPAGWMQADEMRAAVAFPQPARHRPHDFLLLLVLEPAVASENPDQARILVAPPQPLAINLRVLHR